MSSTKNKKYIYSIFSILFFLPAINYFIGGIYLAFGDKNPWSQIIYFIIYGAGLASYFVRFTSFKLVSVCIFSLLLGYSLLINDGLLPAITEVPNFYQSLLVFFVLVNLPVFLISSDSRFNYAECFKELYRWSQIINLLCVITFTLQVFITRMGIGEYMAFAYTTLSPAIICLYFGFNYKDRIGVLISLLAISTIFIGGCRGALFTTIVFIIISFALGKVSKLKKILLLLIALLVFVCGINDLLITSSQFLGQYGYESRILESFMSDDAANSSGRDIVFAKAISLIDISGRGIFSDRILLEHILDATYCHNWILEFLVDYGYIFGTVLVLTIICCFIYLFFNKYIMSDIYYRFILIFGAALLLGKYLLSNSYLQGTDFAFVMGGCIYLIRKSRSFK